MISLWNQNVRVNFTWDLARKDFLYQFLKDEKKYLIMVEAPLLDLSKAFYSTHYDFLKAKCQAYGFDDNSLESIYNLLYAKHHRTKVRTV